MTVIGFTVSIETVELDNLHAIVESNLMFIYDVMREYDSMPTGGLYALDHIENTSKINAMTRTMGGLYAAITKNKSVEEVQHKLVTEWTTYFNKELTMIDNITLNKLLVGGEIMGFVEERLGANKWSDMPSDSRKGLYL